MTKTLYYRNVYEEYALDEILIENIDASIPDSLREYWGNKKIKNLQNLAFHATSLLRLQGHDSSRKQTRPIGPKPQNQRTKTWSSHKSGRNAVRSGSASSSSISKGNISGMQVLEMSHNASQSLPASTDASSLLVVCLKILSTMANAAYCRVCLSKNHKKSQCTFIKGESRNASTSCCNANTEQVQKCPTFGRDRSGQAAFRNRYRPYRHRSSYETKVSTTTQGNSAQPLRACETKSEGSVESL